MSDAKHTPGEWVAIPPAREGNRWRVGAKGVFGGKAALAAAHATWFVAAVDNGAPGDTLETEAANARLMSAAPDLLAACEALLSHTKYGGSKLVTAIEAARGAIAKAKGA